MKTENLISIKSFCFNYDIEFSFIDSLSEYGLIEITTIDEEQFLPKEKISEVEKMIRLHHELGINMEGIDVIYHLLNRLNNLQQEIDYLKNRINFYED